jgi:ClpP class serine protease
MTGYPHLAQRLFNTPIAILPGKAEIVMAALADRFGVAKLFRSNGALVMFDQTGEADEVASRPARDAEYQVVGGAAIIPVTGTLVAKLGTLSPYSGMTGYDGIRQNFLVALADPAVEQIVLDIDSPGGEVAGCFDLVDLIFASRGEKPIAAILTECAYSAAYAIATAVDPGRLYVPRTGGVGSVGVVYLHVDMSQALAKEGVAVTLIHFGDRKIDGADVLPLSADALKRLQADVDTCGELFVETVARNRGLAAQAVRDTQALTFLGAAGVAVGFADAVMAPDDAFAALLG